MKTKFTPGPWKHQATPGGWDGVYAGDQLLCNLALNVLENATLMAAAPDLYAALNECALMFGTQEMALSGDRKKLAYLYRKTCERALKKARGEK